MTEDVLDISGAPGLILKTARDELKLSVEQVAHELHLRASVVRAMEEEKYDEFSSDVFLKGYFRSYCRLVSLHEERMVELLEKQLNTRQKEKDNTDAFEKKAIKSIARKKTAVIVILLVLIIVTGSYIVSTFFTSEASNISGALNAKPTESLDIKSHKASNDKPAEKFGSSLDAPLKDDVLLPANTKSTPIASDAKQMDNFALTDKALNESLPKHGATDNQGITSTERQIEQKAPVLSSFDASFTGDCWFTLKDANGKTVFASLKHAGDTVAYSGLAPYQVVLGDATKVVLIFEGQKISLNSYTARNGRAQFTLKSSLLGQP